MKTLRSLAVLIFGTRWFCMHDLVILRWSKDGRMWTWCLKCGHESKGVQFGPSVG